MAMIGSVIEKQRTQGVTSKHAQAKKEKQAAAQAKSTTHKSTISKAELPKTETVKTAVKLPGKTSGGFYSQPDLFSAAEEKKARMESARNTMNQKAQEFRLANNQVERISGSLKEQEDRIAKLSAAASSGARFAKSLYDVARKNYTDTYNKYETATAAAQKAAADYEPLYGLYAAAWEDYSSYITDQGAQYDAWRATIRSADDVAAEIDQLDKQIESTKKKLTAAQMRNQYAGQYDAAAGFPEWVNNEAGDIAAMEAELKNLQDQRALLGEESEWAKYFGYEEIRNAPDFAEKSQYKPTENGKEEKFNALSGMYTETGFDDITYDFINKNQKAMEHQMVNDISNNASFLGLDQNFLKQMTDDEVRIFNYLYATDGPEKAYAYISDLEADLTKRQRTAEEAQWQQYAKDSPVGSSVFSVLESPLKGLSYLGQIADYAADQKMDQNAGYNKFSYLNTAIRDEVSQDIEKNWGGVGSFAYQTGMSMADFLFNTALSGGNQALALGIMGSGAAADTTIRSKDRGLTDGQAMALGTIAGLAEVITEKVSMDALLKGDWTKSALGFIGKNVLAEGSEEGAADLINIFADVLISKDKSEWSQSIEEYKKQGMNEQDAFLKALEDQLLAIGLDMLGGGISGGVLSGGRVAIGKAGAAAQNAENTKAAGAAIRSMGDNMIDAIIEQGMEFDKTTKSHELAVKAREKRAAGKTLSDAEIGRLYQETSRELDREEAKASETAQRTQDQAPAAEETTRQTSEEEVEEPVQEAQLQTEAQRRLTETAAQYGVDAKTTARVRRISDAVKRNVEFYQDEDAAQNGYYDRSTGTIFVNANSKNPVAQIIGHELTHSIEDAGSYQKLQAVVFRQMERNGINLEQLRQKKKELYARHGVELNDQTAIDSEIVAQYMEKNLLTDETSIRALVKDDRTVGQKIMDQIDKLLAALGNKNAQERVFLTKARRIYADALNETAQGTQDQAPAAEKKSRKQRRAEEEQQQRDKQAERTEEKVRSTTMDKEELAAAYAAGEITEEEFDSAMESIMSDENEAGEDLLGKPVEYSIDENYARDIEEWDRAGRPDGEIFIMGDTGDVLQGLGAMDQDIYIRSEKISTILQEHQEMSLEEIKRIPEILDDPVLVLKSRNRKGRGTNTRMVIFGSVQAQNGQPVLTVLDLRPMENGLVVDDMQKVNSAYTRENGAQFVQSSEVMYADERRTEQLLRIMNRQNKNRNDSSSGRLARTGPTRLLRSGYVGSISYENGKVNLKGVPFEQLTSAGNEEQRRYSFGGENARRADLDALEQAKKMELQGVAADTIFRETGWFTGADGKWRFEFDGRTWEDLLEEKIDTDKEPGYNEKNVLSGNITEEEKGALVSYKSSESYKINAALRDGNTLTSEQARLVKKIDRALQKLPTYRGMANRHISFDLQGEEAMKEFLESHGEGEFVQYLAYTSASTDPEGYLVEGDLTVSIMIESETGRNLEGYGNNFESEILFPRNSVFYVDRVEMDSDGKPVIYIEEVTKNGIKRSGGQLYPEKQYGGVQQVQEIQEGNADLRKVQGVDSRTETGGAVRRIRAEDSAGNELTQQQNPDIRYSVEDQEAEGSQEQEAQEPTQENQAQEQEIQEPDIVTTFSKKAKNYTERAERNVVSAIGNALKMPYYTSWGKIGEVARKISQEYLTKGEISQETMDAMFEQAYESGKKANEKFFKEYEILKENIRTYPVTISQEDASKIYRYNDFLKSAVGRLRILEKSGTPVTKMYDGLNFIYPQLFPEYITEPHKQLVRIFEIAKSIQQSEKNLDEFYGENAGEFKRWAKNEFETAVSNVLPDLRNVKRYAEDRAAKQSFEPSNLTQEQVMELYQDLKKKRKDQEKAIAKNLLTKHDEKRVNELLRGRITLEALDPETDNVKGIRQVYEARQAFEDVAKKIRAWNAERRGAMNDQADKFLETANEWKDKSAGILYSRETMERNIWDIVPDAELADEVIATYFTPVHKAEADANRLKNRMRDKVREMGLSQKVADGNLVSEAHAVQLLGEAEDNIRVLENTRGKNKTRDGKTLDDWKAVVADLWENNPKLNKQKIADAVGEFRKIYDELFQQMNESRVRNGYEPINYRRGYFPHFQPGNSDGILDAFGRALGISTEVTALPTTINGLTHTFKPGIRYMGNALERIGFNTAYDAVEGFDRYIEGAADVIYQTDNIQRLRALARQTRYRTGDEGIRKQIDAVRADQRLTDTEKNSLIKEIEDNGRFKLGNFVVELDEYTNLLANKKSRYDRSIETDTGRRIYNIMKTLENRVAANMVAVNPASWLTNFIPLTQGGGVVGYRELLPAMWDTLRSYKENDGFVDRSTFLTNRRGSDPLVRSWSENMSAVASSPMSWIDSFVADSLVRARYNQNLKNGLSEAASMDEADQWVASVMADRSKGSMPTLFQRNNPLTKLFTQFQLEVNNQLSFVAKDMPRGYKNEGMKVLAAALLRFALGAFLFDELYEFFIGRRPALDPIGILNDTVGDLTGYEMPNLVELGTGALTGNAPDFRTERATAGETIKNVINNTINNMPFTSAIGVLNLDEALGMDIDAGRIALESAILNFGNIGRAITKKNLGIFDRIKEVAGEILDPASYVLPPFGGGQLKKVFQGVTAAVQGGQYSLDSEGNKILQYPVYNDSLVDAVGNLVTGTLFGVTATEGGKEWIENNFKSFNAAQTETYLAMQELGVDGRTAFDLITSIRDAGKNGQGSTATQQRQVIYNSDAPGDAKAAAFYGLLAADSDKSVMDMLDGMGADMGETANALMKMKDADLMEGAAASNAKRQALVDAVLTDNQKIEIYREKISDSRDEDIFAFQDAGLNFNTFLEAQSAYSTINEEYEGASRKALEFSRWVNQQGFTEEQAKVVKDSFAYYNMVPQSGGTYDKFISSGLSDESAYQISTALEELEPEEGEESVSKMQRYKAITNSGLSEEEQMQALSAVMTEAEYGRLKAGYDAGVTPESYVKFKEVLPEYDVDGKGSYKKEEVEAAIRSIPGLSNAQRAALWQSQNKTWKPTGNPFSTSVGQRVHDDLKNAAVLPKETDSDGGIMLPKG